MKKIFYQIILCLSLSPCVFSGFPNLPKPITSFGAVKVGNFLYVYSGHTGNAHVYSKNNHSDKFVRINLKNPKKWKGLPFNQPMQGFGMAAYKGKIYFSGGSQATNKDGEKSNLSSLDDVSVFDPRKNNWEKLTSLPKPRSSHEMVEHDGKLYVIGGWNMKDGQGVEWHDHGLVADLKQMPLKWENLPKSDWAVRANSAAIVNGNLYAVGGLAKSGGTTDAVNRLNLQTLEWSEMPKLPSSNMIKGFGSTAINLNGQLVVGAFSYHPKVYVEANSTWVQSKSKMKEKRFFHRMIQVDETDVLFVGGANWEEHLDSCEILSLAKLEKVKLKPPVVKHESPKEKTSWKGFRGNGNSYSESKELPLQWSDDKNILWRSEISGYGQSTAVIYGDSIFSTSTIGEQSEELIISCHSLNNGSLTWEKRFPAPVKIKRSQYVSQAAPSPVVDNDYVYCFFESGLLITLNHEGELKWKRTLTEEYGPFKGNHGVGSSLFQSENGLGLLIDHSGPSYLLRIEKETGKNSWKIDRAERVSWSTPTLAVKEDSELLFISSNGVVECVDFVNGETLWKEDGLEGNTVASPAFNENLVVVGSSKPGNTMALKQEINEGNKSQVEWVAEDASCSFGSPLVTEKFVYLVNRAGVATCHEIKNGKKLWDLRLPGSCWASPLHSPGRVYFFTKDGVTVVIKDDGSKKIICQNKVSIEGRLYGVAAVNRFFVVRTGSELICIKNNKDN